MEIIKRPEYKVIISAETMQKFDHILYSKYNLEFTAFTHCTREGNVFHIKDIFFPKQINSATVTELDGEDLYALMNDGADLSILSGHIHSHVNMPVTPSKKDKDEVLDRGEIGGFNVAVIKNKDGDVFVHVADHDNNIYISDVEYEIEYPFTEKELEEFIFQEAAGAECLEDLRDAVNYYADDFLEDFFGLDLNTQSELDDIVKERFSTYKRQVVSYGKPYSKGYSKPIVQKSKGWLDLTDEEFYATQEQPDPYDEYLKKYGY